MGTDHSHCRQGISYITILVLKGASPSGLNISIAVGDSPPGQSEKADSIRICCRPFESYPEMELVITSVAGSIGFQSKPAVRSHQLSNCGRRLRPLKTQLVQDAVLNS